jgi:hypothetical protein
MPHENDSLVTSEELAAILRTHEGPPSVRSKPAAVSPRRRPHLRWAFVAVAVALVVGSGLGFGLGASVTLAGSAAQSPDGVGFLPERGWYVMQSGPATPTRQALAFASNVPFDPRTNIRAMPGASARPYSTLEALPPTGIVIVATFTLLNEDGTDGLFRARRLPLRLRDAVPDRWSIGRVRERELPHYTLLAGVNGYDVMLDIYFGRLRPRSAQIAAAQRQLDRLVVRRAVARTSVVQRAFPLRPSTATAAVATPSRLVDRTFVCTPRVFAGARDLDIRLWYPGKRSWGVSYSGYASVYTGRDALDSQLAFVLARSQQNSGAAGFPEAAGAYVNARRCVSARSSVPLSPKGLQGPPARWDTRTTCTLQERVLVRVQARLKSPSSWGPAGGGLVGARRNIVSASVAVRGERTQKAIAYLEMDKAGKTALWSSSRCR